MHNLFYVYLCAGVTIRGDLIVIVSLITVGVDSEFCITSPQGGDGQFHVARGFSFMVACRICMRMHISIPHSGIQGVSAFTLYGSGQNGILSRCIVFHDGRVCHSSGLAVVCGRGHGHQFVDVPC
jgi:hypothetical protein